MTAVEPKHLLNAARNLGHHKHAILDGRWQVTCAALARQATEAAVEAWLVPHGLDTDEKGSFRARFLSVQALHPEPSLVAELYNTWSTLSEACHATSYERPPTTEELRRSFDVVDRFLRSQQHSTD